MDINSKKLASIEFLANPDTQSQWSLIDTPILGERLLPGVVSINSDEVVILGGNDGIWNFLSDCFVFNCNDASIKRAVQPIALAPGSLQVFKTGTDRASLIGMWSQSVVEYYRGPEIGDVGEVRTVCSLKQKQANKALISDRAQLR